MFPCLHLRSINARSTEAAAATGLLHSEFCLHWKCQKHVGIGIRHVNTETRGRKRGMLRCLHFNGCISKFAR